MWPVFGNVPQAVRSLRLRVGLTQAALGARAGVSPDMVSRAERMMLTSMTLGHLDQIAAALGATLHVQVRWRGDALDRLVDAAHASIQQAAAEQLTALGWIIRPEVSFNHYGERGRVDVLAWHPPLRLLLVVEIKSGLGDLQETLGRLDVKTRIGRVIAAELGWTELTGVVPMLVIGDSRAARRTVAEHDALFARYAVRGRHALAWLRRPTAPLPTGLLWFTERPDPQRVRAQ